MSTSSCRPPGGAGLNPVLARERNLIGLLMAFLGTGVFFMLVPGTLLGVWNLIQIGNLRDADAAATLWIQAHGHAQLFGWLGTFILGIGFYSIPNLRKVCSSSFYEGWLCLLLWGAGVGLRWYAGVSEQFWRILFPGSAALEFVAVSYFVYLTMMGTRLSKGRGLDAWACLVITGTIVWQILMLVNIPFMTAVAMQESSPLVPVLSGRRFLFAAVWGFVVPVVWGLSARWLPALLGLREPSDRLLKSCCLLNVLAVSCFAIGFPIVSELMLLSSVACYVLGLRVFSAESKAAKVTGVHPSFPGFVKLAYTWLIGSALLFLVSAFFAGSAGVAGAARHAITVGFFSNMVFTIGPRILPAFLGRKKIFSISLIFLSLLLLNLGCLLRVSAEILAYDFSLSFCWKFLPVSAVIELSAMAVFAFNMVATFCQKPLMDQILEERGSEDKRGSMLA